MVGGAETVVLVRSMSPGLVPRVSVVARRCKGRGRRLELRLDGRWRLRSAWGGSVLRDSFLCGKDWLLLWLLEDG